MKRMPPERDTTGPEVPKTDHPPNDPKRYLDATAIERLFWDQQGPFQPISAQLKSTVAELASSGAEMVRTQYELERTFNYVLRFQGAPAAAFWMESQEIQFKELLHLQKRSKLKGILGTIGLTAGSAAVSSVVAIAIDRALSNPDVVDQATFVLAGLAGF